MYYYFVKAIIIVIVMVSSVFIAIAAITLSSRTNQY